MKNTLTKLFIVGALVVSSSLIAKPLSKMDLINQAKKEVGEVTPKKLKSMLDEGEDVIVLDVRESEQHAEGSIPFDDFNKENFRAVTRGNLEWKINKIIPDKDAYVVTYCRRGGRGALAAQVMKEMGYTHVTTLKGGLKGWAKAGYPVKTGLGNVVLKKQK
ncbi:rhodanese-like domain-containing protein [Sulfurimonas autotrophica]|uniref:Rhodanese domain protein n=1 Tax=Sulfurimonas autotrophica (strain ATCC BAA-671 / DSM 16294 / JCM 11897 / OK10) TaxID=563040 RepID=E0UQY4_SULAO|nr:rhodanese-like domain-containing protein [Sulfurimonas autotrophica]ADN09940.1 Rhodanese domain protein [Sulfurimonas autotrophica DSM 16294]